MAYFDPFPPVLLSIARNPVTAVGLPLTSGLLSGFPTKKVVQGAWYNVCLPFSFSPNINTRELIRIITDLVVEIYRALLVPQVDHLTEHSQLSGPYSTLVCLFQSFDSPHELLTRDE